MRFETAHVSVVMASVGNWPAWAIPGTPGLEHRIGGLEKENITGNISYDPENHQLMVKIRQEKVDKIADYIPEQKIDCGPEKGKLLYWAGVLRTAP